ncbi:cupin [Gemmatimonadetes bacterium T265]|nr:cupin [Gemmatimonadetes bacterium T265]
MPVDVLSSVLHDLRVEGSVYCRFEARGAWAVRYPRRVEGAAFHVVTEGTCELRLDATDGADEEVHALSANDFAIVPHGRAHVLGAPPGPSGARGCRPVGVDEVVAGAGGGRPVALGSGRAGEDPVAAGYVCGSFRFAGRRPHPAIAALPEVLVVRGTPGRADGGPLGPWLPTHLAAVACEAASGRPGADVVLARLSDVLFVHAIRAHLADAPAGAGGWVGALRDPAVARALALLHAHPERDWTVAGLAREVAMSRSRFAARFAALVGRPPLGYLADWRMHRAEGWLADEGATVGEVAARLGYRSEAAFSHAFRRRVGASPGAVRRRVVRRTAPSSGPLSGAAGRGTFP